MNAPQIALLYPEFSMRIYHDKLWIQDNNDDDQPMEDLCEIACEFENVDLCSAYQLGKEETQVIVNLKIN